MNRSGAYWHFGIQPCVCPDDLGIWKSGSLQAPLKYIKTYMYTWYPYVFVGGPHKHGSFRGFPLRRNSNAFEFLQPSNSSPLAPQLCHHTPTPQLLTPPLLDGTPSKETWRKASNGHGSTSNALNRSTLLPTMSSQSSRKASRPHFRYRRRNGHDFVYGIISTGRSVPFNPSCVTPISFLNRSSLRWL